MKHLRLYANKQGDINIYDPNSGVADFLNELIPTLKPDKATWKYHKPYLGIIRDIITNCTSDSLKTMSAKQLLQIHNMILAEEKTLFTHNEGVNLLDLKIAIAEQEVENCCLCGNSCGVNRFISKGQCGLGIDAFYTSAYVHLAEESLINPALAINLEPRCGLDCCFCQSKGIAETTGLTSSALDGKVWQTIADDLDKATSLEFAGGSPDENILSILKLLKEAPELGIPIVSNCHLYAQDIVYKLWDGIIDVYVADFKFGNDQCSQELAGIDNYVTIALNGLKAIFAQSFKPEIIIRHLVLPGHVECCSIPALRMLAPFRKQILLNVMSQYVPEHKILKGQDPELNQRVSPLEIERVMSEARCLGFRML
jgi:putative pyruvate formate lyase activating enzyme